MLSINGIRNACPRCNHIYSLSASRHIGRINSSSSRYPSFASQYVQPRIVSRYISNSRCARQEISNNSAGRNAEEIEKVVREAKQRFRDTLPKDYLSKEEYALYERLYGPPLRETAPEDVGIPTHADMGSAYSRRGEGTLLRELEDGELEEVAYEISEGQTIPEKDSLSQTTLEGEQIEESAQELVEKAPGYVDVIARNPREHDALQKLLLDFEAAQLRQAEEQDMVEASADGGISVEGEDLENDSASLWPDEESSTREVWESGEARRFHRYTLEGRFHGSPVEVSPPQDELLMPLRTLLDRTHPLHVKAAAEAAFGGQGLPTSPATPEGRRNGQMGGVGLHPDQRHMTEIEADAFLAGYMPPAYASSVSILREVRKRVGGDWIQSRLKQAKDGAGGLSVLDAGAAGAGLVAWEQIINAEWDLLREKGEVQGLQPLGKKTAIVGSDRLRHRIKSFLPNTTFLPRLPDYEHSGETKVKHLDAGSTLQARKSYDIIIASHLFLKETQDHYRQAILNNLWSLLNKDGGVLIIVEKAHPRGFEAVAHVRDTVLKQFLLPQSDKPKARTEEFNPAFHRELEHGSIIAPCTNHEACPMYKEPGKSKGRKDYCHFSQRFVQPTFYSKVVGTGANNQGDVEFSYVAIRRGVSKSHSMTGKEAVDQAFQGYEQSEAQPDMQSLPRIILPPLKRKGHVTLDVCTPEGEIERWTVPKSFSKLAYHDARKSRWGDLWALGAKTRVPRSVRVGSGVENGGKRAADGKKPRRMDNSMEEDRLSAYERDAPQARRSKSKRDKKTDLIKELLEAEVIEEREIEREIDMEAEAALEEEEHRGNRRNTKSFGS